MTNTGTLAMTRGDLTKFRSTLSRNSIPITTTPTQVWFTAKKKATDADDKAVFQKTWGDGIAWADQPNGVIEITLQPEDTSTLTRVKWVLEYDIQVLEPSGQLTTTERGKLTVNYDVTVASI
jgi:isochorismate hydrolase